ncbi:glutathione S-transferase family protein [Myxococcaceae bacterium JPH2]|nr:glutathione S-transferase family protein [Myxococcaceae bacterium JPH2]
MLTVHASPGAWGLASISPFCIKLESYLKMVGLPYRVVPADPRAAPKGKVPFIVDGNVRLGDSQFIIEYLKQNHGDPLDAKLGTAERALGHAVRRMLEEGTYFHSLHERWLDDEGWRVFSPVFRGLFPPFLRPFGFAIAGSVRRQMRRTLHGQGTGRHSREEIQAMARDDLSAVATLLGNKPFLLGDAPTSFDATVYAFVASVAAFPVDSSARRYVLAQDNLVKYQERFQQRFFQPTRLAA